jgi:hypothetical protein
MNIQFNLILKLYSYTSAKYFLVLECGVIAVQCRAGGVNILYYNLPMKRGKYIQLVRDRKRRRGGKQDAGGK